MVVPRGRLPVLVLDSLRRGGVCCHIGGISCAVLAFFYRTDSTMFCQRTFHVHSCHAPHQDVGVPLSRTVPNWTTLSDIGPLQTSGWQGLAVLPLRLFLRSYGVQSGQPGPHQMNSKYLLCHAEMTPDSSGASYKNAYTSHVSSDEMTVRQQCKLIMRVAGSGRRQLNTRG